MFMDKNNINRWEPTKFQIDNIILPAYTDLSKRCIFISMNLNAHHNT